MVLLVAYKLERNHRNLVLLHGFTFTIKRAIIKFGLIDQSSLSLYSHLISSRLCSLMTSSILEAILSVMLDVGRLILFLITYNYFHLFILSYLPYFIIKKASFI
jgi:hypothetical protein